MSSADDTARVLASADALIRRHRVFVAGAGDSTSPTPPPSEETDDVPVLTDVVPDPVIGTQAADMVRQQHLEATLATWLDEQLPLAVLRITDGWSDQLIAALTERMKEELLPNLLKSLDDSPVAGNPGDLQD